MLEGSDFLELLDLLVRHEVEFVIVGGIGRAWTFADLLAQSDTFEIAGFRARAIRLEVLIESKEIADRPKDRYALPFLRQLLALRRGEGSG